MKRTISLIIVLNLLNINCFAQSQEKVYALMLLNFAKNIQWPTNQVGNSFTIGVMAYPPLITEMKGVSQSKVIAGKKIEIKEVNSLEEVSGCEILFIPAFKSKKLPDVAEVIGRSPTLVVTNAFQLSSGSSINFLLKNGKVTYQISTKTIESMGLKIPTNVKNMGIIVD